MHPEIGNFSHEYESWFQKDSSKGPKRAQGYPQEGIQKEPQSEQQGPRKPKE